MDLSCYPPDVKKFIRELKRRKVIQNDDIVDKTLINYLYSQRYDKDYIESMKKDR